MKKMSHCSIFLLFALLLHLSSCQSDSQTPATEPTIQQYSSTLSTTEEANPAAQVPTIAIYMIESTGFFGIQLGQTITDIEGVVVERGVWEDGEGSFDVYYMLDPDGEELGYFYPAPNDESKVGDMVITSPKAYTKDDFKIGTTFETIQNTMKNPKVMGSEIESRTYVVLDNIYLRLEHASTKVDLQASEVPNDTKVMSILITQS